MGVDVDWVTDPLGGRLTLHKKGQLISESGHPPIALADPLEMTWAMFRAFEMFGDYFRVSSQSWSMIVAEMESQGMLDGAGISCEKMHNGQPVTPGEIDCALRGAGIQPRLTTDELKVVTAANPFERMARNTPLKAEVETGADAKIARFPSLWAKWLCYMERAAALGEGFRVTV